MVDAVDEGSVVECDKVVGWEGGRVGVVCKFLHELEGRTVASDSANGVLWLTCREREYECDECEFSESFSGGGK